jgi:hypothetical protein
MYKGAAIVPSLNQKLDYLEWWIPDGDDDRTAGIGSSMILVN